MWHVASGSGKCNCLTDCGIFAQLLFAVTKSSQPDFVIIVREREGARGGRQWGERGKKVDRVASRVAAAEGG